MEDRPPRECVEGNSVRLSRSDVKDRGALYFNLIGPSMTPFLRAGDVLRVMPFRGERIRRGDVVVFRPKKADRLVTHRVISAGRQGLRMQGDNNRLPDPWPIRLGRVVGKVTHIERSGRLRTVASGVQGRVLGFGARCLAATRHWLFLLVRPLYLRAAEGGWFRPLFLWRARLKVVAFTHRAGIEHQVILAGRVLAWLKPGQERWRIRPPFRLFLDEADLPAPQRDVCRARPGRSRHS